MALPNNSNKENIQYEENAAIFTMIEEPNDTTFNKDINIKGSTDKDGTISIKVNNVYIKENEVKNNGEMFEENITLQPGRNEIEISQVTAEGKKSLKTYNIVYLTNESFQIMVDKNYTGEEGLHLNGVKVYNSITKAIESVSTKNKKRVTIFVRNGEYKEKATVAAPYISIVGEDSEKTIWTFDDANATINPETGEKYGTSKSASVTVKKSAAGFTAENITFENSLDEQGLVEGEQAVALNNQADKSIFINCRFLGNQDTLLADASKTSPSRQYYYNCYIEGDVDFIFGRAQAVFDNCDIASYNKNSVNNGYITAADTWDKDPYGYLIMNSRLIGLDNIKGETVSLGRPWRPSSVTETMTPSVVYVNNYMGNHISTKGWDDMGVNSLAKDSRFFEFASFGPGARLSNTRNVLDLEEAAEYTMENVFSKGAAKTLDGLDAYAEDWNPSSVSSDINMHNLYKGNGEEFIPIILVESVSLDKTVIDCKIGYTDILTAAINPDNASNKEITWSSSDESVVSVDENGNITALKAGIAEIKAAVDGKEAVCTVNVTTDEKPEIIAEDLVVYLKDKFDAKNYVEAIDLEDGNITDKVVVKENTVNTSRVGTYKVIYEITDTDNNTTVKEISVQVKKPVLVSRISLEKTSLTLDNGQSYKMNAAVSPSNASRPELKWSSSNENVAVVDSEGNVTATGKGTTYIYANATDGSRKKVYAMVTVVQRVESIKINNEDSVLKTGDSLQLSAALNPNTANNKTVYWSSSNNSAVTVSRTGKVTAVGAGTATITVRSADGGKEDTITIIVKDSIKSVELNKGLLTLSKRNNESYNLIATINSPNAQVRSIEWSSSNTNIVKVDGNGKVTAVGRGMTKVTVTVTGELGEKVTESCLVVVL